MAQMPAHRHRDHLTRNRYPAGADDSYLELMIANVGRGACQASKPRARSRAAKGDWGDLGGRGGDAHCDGLCACFDFQAPRLFSISAVKFVGDWRGEAYVELCPTCSFNER